MFVEVIVGGKVAYPKYRVPTAGVRIVGTLVGPVGFEPMTSQLRVSCYAFTDSQQKTANSAHTSGQKWTIPDSRGARSN